MASRSRRSSRGPMSLLEGEPVARLRPPDEGDLGVGRRVSDRDRRDAHSITRRSPGRVPG